MAIYHEHPTELQSALSDFCYIRLILRNMDSGVVASIYVRLGEFIRDKIEEELTKADLDALLHSIHYLSAPRNYLVVKIRERYIENFLTATEWDHLTDRWYIYKNILSLLPCTWKTTSESIRLMRYEIVEWACLD